MALGLFIPRSIYEPQAAFKYAAQKSQVAATDTVFSTRHNNRADKKNAASQVYPGTVGGTTRATVQYKITCSGWVCFHSEGEGSNPTIKWNPVCVYACLCVCVCVCVRVQNHYFLSFVLFNLDRGWRISFGS